MVAAFGVSIDAIKYLEGRVSGLAGKCGTHDLACPRSIEE
ncbi:hypothetical protein PLANPX_1566 [Lacipirellula parvula]|uniref:Uncharacterized protein n=1 Tax=Lacipirellula parvula TaxID=2650471 RepID=A0A5K7X5G7_9BACT|nr:hypothetical protein PLANPX_1566 [Lacipirellula parvula]